MILGYLTDLLAWASNLQLLYAAFNSVTYIYSGHIVIYSSRVLDGRKPCLRLDIDKVYSRKRNISHMSKTHDHPRVRYHQCGDFDLLDSIFSRPKWQPDSNLKERFEKKNELQLHRITLDIVIIKDK